MLSQRIRWLRGGLGGPSSASSMWMGPRMIALCLRAQVETLVQKGIVLLYLNAMELEYHMIVVCFSGKF